MLRQAEGHEKSYRHVCRGEFDRRSRGWRNRIGAGYPVSRDLSSSGLSACARGP